MTAITEQEIFQVQFDLAQLFGILEDELGALPTAPCVDRLVEFSQRPRVIGAAGRAKGQALTGKARRP